MEAALTGPLGRFALSTTKLTIGRAPDNMLVLNDSKVSSHHAEVRPEGQSYNLVDLGSTNGTFVNEQQVYAQVPRRLQPGDVLRFGDTKYTFDAGSALQGRYPISDGSTVRATPPMGIVPPVGTTPNSSGNTSYGMGNANYDDQAYRETIISHPSYAAPEQPQQQQPLVLGGQPPSYNNPAYGVSGTLPVYSPQQPVSPPMYAPAQPPPQPLPPPVYNPPAPQPEPRKRSLWLSIVLVVVALLVILGAVGGFLIHNNQVAQDNSNATATSQSQANANATSTALALANAHASATASANLTATAVVTSHFPPFTTLAFHDALTTNSSQWPSNSTCQFSASGYQISIAQAGNFQWCSPTATTKYGDFAFQVTMAIQSGDCGGLLFRLVDNNNYYIVLVCADGTFDLGLFQNNKPTWASDLAKRPSSTAIHQGIGQQNVIAIVAQGNTFNLYVNDLSKDIDTLTDNGNTFSQGSIGLLASDFTNPTSVKYTNALVWTQ